MDLAFSPDGSLLAAGCGLGNAVSDGYLGLWDASSGQPLGPTIPSPAGRIESIAFSPDGQTLASASWTGVMGAVALWDVASQQLIGQPLPSTHASSVAFSPDGQVLASGRNRAIILWDVSLEAWQVHACHMANRNLTPEEWVSHLGDQPYEKTCPDLP
jgi:WD40 repeat protein